MFAKRRMRGGCVATVVACVAGLGITTLPAAATPGDVTFTGHGFGHGRGMGQWGAFGYAVDHGWSYQQILDRFYGGTSLAGDAGNPTITVQLMAQNGIGTIAAGPGLTVDGVGVGAWAVGVSRVGANSFQVYSAPDCGGPWTPRGGPRGSLTLATAGDPANPNNLIRLCQPGKITGYRGHLVVVDTPSGQATVNSVALNDYLRGVLPREMPASWGSAGGGRGLQALMAQAVAARSYALASNRAPYAQTCDTTACQVYGGAFIQSGGSAPLTPLEDSRTDAAATQTSGHVRRTSSGAIARTEFSASTGGWSAGGTFPAVEDAGDATAGNPNHNWTVTIPLADIGPRLGTAPVTDIRVTQRNGLGADGGRVLQAVLSTTAGQVTLAGDQIRTGLGLRSNWFSTGSDPAFIQALYHDMLSKWPTAAEIEYWNGLLRQGVSRPQVVAGLARSVEYQINEVWHAYQFAFGRAPDGAGMTASLQALQRGIRPSHLALILMSSDEFYQRWGATPEWFVNGLYQVMLNRPADAPSMTAWGDVVRQQGRWAAVAGIYNSSESGHRRMERLYWRYLGGPPGEGYGGVPALIAHGDESVRDALVLSPLYATRAQLRFP